MAQTLYEAKILSHLHIYLEYASLLLKLIFTNNFSRWSSWIKYVTRIRVALPSTNIVFGRRYKWKTHHAHLIHHFNIPVATIKYSSLQYSATLLCDEAVNKNIAYIIVELMKNYGFRNNFYRKQSSIDFFCGMKKLTVRKFKPCFKDLYFFLFSKRWHTIHW